MTRIRGTRKTSEQFYHEMVVVVTAKGGRVITPTYLGSNTEHEFICELGHSFKTVPGRIKQGVWCWHANPRAKHNIGMLQEHARKKEGRLLSPEYIGSEACYWWECRRHHQFQAIWNQVKNAGSWCPFCAGNAPHTIEMLQDHARQKGGRLISTEYTNSREYYVWECHEHHQFPAVWDTIHNRDTWCPHCYGNAPHTLNMIQEYAHQKGGYCLSLIYINARMYYFWMCGHGHTWWSTWNTVSKGSWCPHCYGNVNMTIEDMQQIAASKGGKFISDRYTNAKEVYEWECKEGHHLELSYNQVFCGRWCDTCKGTRSSLEVQLHDILDKMLATGAITSYKPQYTNPSVSPKHYDAIVYLTDGRRKLIEVDGKQHMEKVTVFHNRRDSFLKSQDRDRFKTFAPWTFDMTLVRIAYSDARHMEEHLLNGFVSMEQVYYSNPELYKYISESEIHPLALKAHSESVHRIYEQSFKDKPIPLGLPRIQGMPEVKPAPPRLELVGTDSSKRVITLPKPPAIVKASPVRTISTPTVKPVPKKVVSFGKPLDRVDTEPIPKKVILPEKPPEPIETVFVPRLVILPEESPEPIETALVPKMAILPEESIGTIPDSNQSVLSEEPLVATRRRKKKKEKCPQEEMIRLTYLVGHLGQFGLI